MLTITIRPLAYMLTQTMSGSSTQTRNYEGN